MFSLVFEINNVYAVFKQNDSNYDLSEEDILGIQNALLSGNYHFSPLRLVRGSNIAFDVEASLADEVVIGALCAILIQELGLSSDFRKSCYSTYTKERSFHHYLDTIPEWSDI